MFAKFKIHVGEVKTVRFYPNPQPSEARSANEINMTGATVLWKLVSPAGIAFSHSMTVGDGDNWGTVAGDGRHADYKTTATDFVEEGIYHGEWFIYPVAGEPLKSDITPITVGGSL